MAHRNTVQWELSAIFFILLLTGRPAGAQDVPLFRGDASRTGMSTSAPVTSLPEVKWAFRTGGRIIGSPAIVGDRAYVGSTDGKLYAIDLQTGRQAWAFATKARVASTPAVAGGVVYFLSYDGSAYALDARTGAQRWAFKTGGERRFAGTHLHGYEPAAEKISDPYDVYLSSPVVSSGSVYFGSGDGKVYALDAASGALRWAFVTGDVVHASPAISDGIVFIGSWDSFFYAIDATTGKLRWRFAGGTDPTYHNQMGFQSTAAISRGIVYVASRDGHLYALDGQTGRRRWVYDNQESWGMSSPAVNEGVVYYTTADTRRFNAIDARDGHLLFSLTFSWYFSASPTIAGQWAYVGNWDGTLSAIDLTRRRVGWTFQTDSSRRNKALYVNPDGSMNFGSVKTESFPDDFGVQFSKIFRMGSILSTAVIAGGVVYVGSTDGSLYALR